MKASRQVVVVLIWMAMASSGVSAFFVAATRRVSPTTTTTTTSLWAEQGAIQDTAVSVPKTLVDWQAPTGDSVLDAVDQRELSIFIHCLHVATDARQHAHILTPTPFCS